MMFNEPVLGNDHQRGWIEVICGPMFSGKTEELLRRLRRARIASLPIAIFKPEIDTRYSPMRIVSHDANYYPSLAVPAAGIIRKQHGSAKVVAIDEAQFFDEELIEVVQELALSGKRVIAAGLDMDYKGRPFGIMPQLLSVANFITKLNAICVVCGNQATHSYRKVEGEALVQLGERDIYEPRCRTCFYQKAST